MEELHLAIMKLATKNSPRLLAQNDCGESTISTIELDAAGSMKSRTPSVKHFTGYPPPRHPAHSYNSSHNSNYPNVFRFPNPPQQQRSISDRIHNPSPVPTFDTRPRIPTVNEPKSFAQQLAELPGSEPSDTASSDHRLSSASSDVLGWDQPSIRRQPANLGSPQSDNRPFSAGAGAQRAPDLAYMNQAHELEDSFADRANRESMFTASSARSIAHPWPPDSTANSVLNFDSTSIYSGRRTQMTMDPGMNMHEMPPTEPPMTLLRTRSTPGQYVRPGTQDRTSGSLTNVTDEDEDLDAMEEKGIATRDQQHAFEQNAFRNSAILCDV